jgi:hypothetical protein
MCWWPNLASLEKPDYPVWKIRVFDFPSFRIGSKNELNMKIWRSKYVWSMKKERRNIKEPTHVLTTNFDILWKPEHPFFTVVRWSIFPNGVKLYIFHKLDHASMFFRLCMCFSENLVEFHSRNKEVLQTTIRWTQTKDLKLSWWSPHRDDQNGYMKHMIWSLDEEVMSFWKCSRLQNRRFRFSRIRLRYESKLSVYLVRILWFMENAMSSRLYKCRS